MTQSHDLSTRPTAIPTATFDLASLLQEVLDATMELHGADFGDIQLYDEATKMLKIVAHRGVTREFLHHFETVDASDTSGCGLSRRAGARVVIEDVNTHPDYEPHRGIAAATGYRGLQSTPLFDRTTGKLLGMLSTLFREPYRPSARDLRLTDLYARQAADVIASRLAARELAETNERLRLERSLSKRLIDSSLSGIVVLDREYRYTIFNPAMEKMTGIPRTRVLGRVIFEAFPFINGTAAAAAWRRAIERQEASTVADLHYSVPETGRECFCEASYSPLYGSGGECIGGLALMRDTTEHHRMEEAVRQSQRLEAIAQLTGGVAHDFNNLLTVISGNIELLKWRRANADRVVGAIERATARGQSLTRQLLSFSRQQALQPKLLDLHARMPRLIDLLLRPFLRGDIEIIADVAEDVWPVEVDPGELELALLNIAVNARDAMPNGGTLNVGIRNERLDGGSGEPDGVTGEFVRIAISDTGMGIPADILGKVFEPFFTTKEVGKGTGLGLSQVHGFATQSGGTSTITSAEGQGTTITLLLPRSAAPPLPPVQAIALQAPRRGSGIVPLVEDN